MGLKQLTTALLPAAYREQVLGDLQERGFRPRDVLSVLPRVWWSHLTRAGTARPQDPELHRAWQRSMVRNRWFMMTWSVALAIRIRFEPGGQTFNLVLLAIIAVALPLSLILKGPVTKMSGAALRKHCHSVLETERIRATFGMPYVILGFTLAGTFKANWGQGAHVLFFFAWIAACILYGQLRARRLQKELNTLA